VPHAPAQRQGEGRGEGWSAKMEGSESGTNGKESMIELLTKRGRIRDVANRWASQYPAASDPDGPAPWQNKQAILKRLLALDLETAQESQVTEAIGNSSWTRISCDCCDAELDAAVVLGEPPNYESATAIVCLDCLKKAVQLIESNKEK
jgi:hypothetical protein